MSNELRSELSKFLLGFAEELDISPTQYESAVQRYKAVGEWLNKEDSAIAKYNSDIYPQGSFRLGTMVKPISDGDEYDIDLVCELKALSKAEISPKELKTRVGKRLKENQTYQRMITEGKRCWTLIYSEATRFHMDILPAIPDRDRADHARMAGVPFTTEPILITDITDKELQRWLRSNPKGYCEWFKDRMKVQFLTEQKRVATLIRLSVEDVPDYKVKTPLQRVIQILKRHRDIMFEEDQDDKPISIIITTLAAHSYNNETDLLEALLNIVNQMPNYIENREGVYWVQNPVDSNENFADKWQKYPQRERKFRVWLNKVRSDINTALQKGEVRAMTESLKSRFGDRMVNLAVSKAFPTLRESDNRPQQSVPIVNIEKPSKPWGS